MNDAIIIVGGGLSGLAAATYLARAGARVTVLERAAELGGRAKTTVEDGFALNFGPHALYAGGAGVRVLAELGVAFRGALPATSGLLGIARGALHTLPGGLLSILSTDLLGFGAKVEAARILATMSRIDAARWLDVPLADAQRLFLHLALRGVTSAAVRLGALGPHEAQRLQSDSAAQLDRVLGECAMLDLDALAQPAPILEIVGAQHDRLYSRLFQS